VAVLCTAGVRVDVVSVTVESLGGPGRRALSIRAGLAPAGACGPVLRVGAGAVLAGTDDREVSETRRVAELPLDLLADRVQTLGGNGGDLGAVLAVEVFDFVRAGQHVKRGRVAEVQVMDHPALLKQFQVAVDGGLIQQERPG
jgi:hypothetical protein